MKKNNLSKTALMILSSVFFCLLFTPVFLAGQSLSDLSFGCNDGPGGCQVATDYIVQDIPANGSGISASPFVTNINAVGQFRTVVKVFSRDDAGITAININGISATKLTVIRNGNDLDDRNLWEVDFPSGAGGTVTITNDANTAVAFDDLAGVEIVNLRCAVPGEDPAPVVVVGVTENAFPTIGQAGTNPSLITKTITLPGTGCSVARNVGISFTSFNVHQDRPDPRVAVYRFVPNVGNPVVVIDTPAINNTIVNYSIPVGAGATSVEVTVGSWSSILNNPPFNPPSWWPASVNGTNYQTGPSVTIGSIAIVDDCIDCVLVCNITSAGLTNTTRTGNNAISFDLNPTGNGIGATYNVSVSGGGAASISPTMGTYGAAQTFTLNDGTAGGGNVTVTLTDINDPNCTFDVSVTDPGPRPLACDITASGLANVTRNNNNAIIFDLNPTGTDLGATYNVSVSGGSATTASPTGAAYGSATTFTLNDGTAGSGNVTVTLTDVNDSSCTFDFSLTDPGPRPLACDITASGLANVTRNNNNAIIFDLNPTGTDLGATYNVSVSGGSATTASPTGAAYGSATTFTLNDGTAGSGNVTVTLTDVNDSSCTFDFSLTDPGPRPLACDITASGLANVTRNNNNAIIFDLNPTGTDLGATYNVSVSGGSATTASPTGAAYGSATTFTLNDGTAGSGNVTVTLTDVNDSSCTFDFSLTDPGPRPLICDIMASGLANESCVGNNAVTFDLTPTGTDVGATYNVTVSSGTITPASGNYNVATSFALNDGAAGSTVTVTITDVNDAGCTLDVPITTARPLLGIIAAASCEDENGAQVAANTYYVEVSAVTGGNGGPYAVTVDGVTESFTGMTLFFGPFTHSGVGGAVQVVSVTDNGANANNCEATGLYQVPEVLCGINDGGQDPGCFCAGPTTDPSVPTSFILAQSEPGTFQAGGSTGQIQKYVLVNDQGIIVGMNLTGLFETSVAGTYTPYAINYQADEDPTVMNFLLVGQPIQPVLDGVNGSGPLAGICFSACNITDPVMYTTCSCYSVGSTVFADVNNDGMLTEANENGLPGIVVELYNAGDDPLTDDPIGTATTDSNGDYYFGGLNPGDYFINLPAVPTGLPNSSTVTDNMDNGEDNDDNGIQSMANAPTTSPVFTLGNVEGEPSGAAESGTGGTQDDAADAFGDMTQDFGFFAPVSVGDTTFVDVDGNGIQSVGDLPLPGVTVTIFDAATGAAVAFDAEGVAYTSTQVTNAMGAYLFENLPPGSYYVQFDISTVTNAEYYDFTTPNVGDDADDSDATPTTPEADVASSGTTPFLSSGESDLTLDAGIACAITVTVAAPSTICSTQTIDLTQGASISPASLGGNWSTPDGDGDFDGGISFSTATTYTPSAADAKRGFVTLVLTTNDPVSGPCEAVSAMVRFEILNVDCGSFFWNGGN